MSESMTCNCELYAFLSYDTHVPIQQYFACSDTPLAMDEKCVRTYNVEFHGLQALIWLKESFANSDAICEREVGP